MSNFTDQCPIESMRYGMSIQHQAAHVVEWWFDRVNDDPRNLTHPTKQTASKVICICGEIFDINVEATEGGSDNAS